jgi:dTDP-4-dehydrorhamnose 3,5-epimerase
MPLQTHTLELPGVILIEGPLHKDERGFFYESFREMELAELGLPRFVQDNFSHSVRGVLRGLHYQLAPADQAKLVRCLAGKIFDVAVDIRKDSPTYGQHASVRLSGDKNEMLYVPSGFAHGFCVLSDEADVMYKVTNYYSPKHERSVAWNDAELRIPWPVRKPSLAPKDAAAPPLAQAENNFTFVR